MSDDDGWVSLRGVGQRLGNLAPDFDPRTYGVAKLGDLVTKTGAFEVRREGGDVSIRPRTDSRGTQRKPAPLPAAEDGADDGIARTTARRRRRRT
jgi:hypothetical protein